MFLNRLFQKGIQGVRGIKSFTKQMHTQMSLDSLFDQRKKINDEWKKKENEWDDDDHEQKRAFREEEERNDLHSEKRQPQQHPQQQPQLKCEMTGKAKTPGSVDCNCKRMCTVKKSETYLIYYEGGIGVIPKK
jgi:hypothetical protein